MRQMVTTKLMLGLAVFCLLVISFQAKPVDAQNGTQATPTPTPTPTPISEELRQLRERNAILTEQKSAAQLEKDILAIQFPQSAATPLEGKTTVSDNSAIESQAVTYQALARAADRMICHFNWLKGNSSPQTDSKVEYPCEIKPASSTKPLGNLKKLVIYEGNEMDQFMAYGIAKERLRLMGEEYDKILAPPPQARRQT